MFSAFIAGLKEQQSPPKMSRKRVGTGGSPKCQGLPAGSAGTGLRQEPQPQRWVRGALGRGARRAKRPKYKIMAGLTYHFSSPRQADTKLDSPAQ